MCAAQVGEAAGDRADAAGLAALAVEREPEAHARGGARARRHRGHGDVRGTGAGEVSGGGRGHAAEREPDVRAAHTRAPVVPAALVQRRDQRPSNPP
jgi:hypothetical protein